MEGSGMTSDREQQRRREGVIFLILFALTIPAANWLIGHVGTDVHRATAPASCRSRPA